MPSGVYTRKRAVGTQAGTGEVCSLSGSLLDAMREREVATFHGVDCENVVLDGCVFNNDAISAKEWAEMQKHSDGQVELLSLRGCGLETIEEPVEPIENVSHLILVDNPDLVDYSFLSKFPDLVSLDLGCASVDLEPPDYKQDRSGAAGLVDLMQLKPLKNAQKLSFLHLHPAWNFQCHIPGGSGQHMLDHTEEEFHSAVCAFLPQVKWVNGKEAPQAHTAKKAKKE